MTQVETKSFPLWMIAAFTVPLLILLGSGVWFYHAENDSARLRNEKQLTAIAHLQVNQITAWRSERLSDAAEITGNSFLAKSVARFMADAKGVGAEEIRSYLRRKQTHFRATDIYLVDPKGQVRLSLKENKGSS